MIGILKVSPEQLRTSAQSFANTGNSVSNLTSQMTSLVQSLSSAWSGEASSAYASKFNQLNDDIQRLIKMINEHSTDLQQMAATYEQAETSNVEIANDLSADVIQ